MSLAQPEWDLVFVLPNLSIKEPFESEHIAIVPFDDVRLVTIRNHLPVEEKLLTSFRNTFGRAIEPPALIVRNDTPDRLKYDLEVLIAFRNIFAFSSLARAWARTLIRGQSFGDPLYSDFFDFYPVTVGPNKMLRPSTPIVLGLDDPESFTGQCSPQVVYPLNSPPSPDTDLLERLVTLWKRRYVKRRDIRKSESVFRSLQVAFQAAYSPFENATSIYDLGTKVTLWVSAFEILLHPGGAGRIGLNDVLAHLGGINWKHSRLKQKNFKIRTGRTTRQACLAEKLYHRLYKLRNDFAHGNPIRQKAQYALPDREQKHLMVHVAPILFRQALFQRITQIWYQKRKQTEWDVWRKNSWLGDDYVEALLKVAGVDTD
jgi:hypothetical protein